jgi:hypothetical protein
LSSMRLVSNLGILTLPDWLTDGDGQRRTG